MSGSPLRKNYIKEIRGLSPYKNQHLNNTSQSNRKPQLRKKQNNEKIQVYENCFRSVIPVNRSQTDYFEFLLFYNGIFNINLIHISNIQKSQQKRNLNKNCIPTEERKLKSIYLFPTQNIVQCQYNLQNQLHKEMIIYCPGEYLIVNNFSKGKLDKEQWNFSLKNNILVKTSYEKGKISSVKEYYINGDENFYGKQQVSKGNHKISIRLQKYFRDKQLCQTIYHLTEGFIDWLQSIQTVSGNTSFFGKLQQDSMLPHGLGLLIHRKSLEKEESKSKRKTSSDKSVSQFRADSLKENQEAGWEFYYGVFQYGLLQGVGCIWFQNKSTLFGEFQCGKSIGLGQFFCLKSNIENQEFDCFSFKDDQKSIKRPDFMRWLREQYFYGPKLKKDQDHFIFIQNQYQKLRRIYAVQRKSNFQKQLSIQEKTEQLRQNPDQQTQIDDFLDEINQAHLKGIKQGNKNRKMQQQKQQDITFNPKDDIKNMFEKLRVTNAYQQKPVISKQKKSKPLNFDGLESSNKKAALIKNTSRSDDHTYNLFSNRKEESRNEREKRQEKYDRRENIKQRFQNQEDYQLGVSSKFKNNYSQEVDLGFQEVDSEYFEGKQRNRAAWNYAEQDFVQKEYAFEQPKNLKTPQYFIVEHSKNENQFDPSISKSSIFQEKNSRKAKYMDHSPFKKQVYLSPDERQFQKENEQSAKRYEKALNTGKIKKLFYKKT